MDNYTGHREVFSCDFGPRNGAENVTLYNVLSCYLTKKLYNKLSEKLMGTQNNIRTPEAIFFRIVCILLGTSSASDCDLPTFRNFLLVPSSKARYTVLSGTDRRFRNVGKSQYDAGEIPKRIHTIR
jgi:hypothetical protein